MCAYFVPKNNHVQRINADYTEYTEYCQNHQNKSTIAESTINNQTKQDIDSNAGYEEYNERK